MGLLGSLFSAAVKVAVTPIAIVADVVDIAEGEVPTNTIATLGSAVGDVVEGIEDGIDGLV